MNTRLSRSLCCFTVCISLLLYACGGSDTQIGGIDGSGAPVTASTVSTGAINGFGSVIVNGVRYNSDKAKILIDEQLVTEDSLHIGYQVKITSTINSSGAAVADSIEFHPNLVGPISQINLSTQQFTVLGHTVQVNSATVFDIAITPNYLEGLKPGDTVLVSGSFDDQGLVTATRIELTATTNRQILGYISNLHPENFTFSLKDLTVNYSAATLSNFNNNQLDTNLWVSATGSIDAKGIFQATTVVRINNSFDKTVKSAEAEGFVTRFVSTTDFDVAGIKASTTTQTSFENGTSTNLGLAVALSIKGDINSAGVLVAQKVEFKNISKNEIAGEVIEVSTPSSTTISTGTLKIGDTSIQTNSRTAFEDKSHSFLRRFNFSDIRIGDFLKVSGYNNQGIFIATKIERQEINTDNDTDLKYDGIVSSAELHSFMLYGRTIITNSSTTIHGNNGETLSETQFTLQAIGKRVKVEGILKNGVFTAKEIVFVSGDHD